MTKTTIHSSTPNPEMTVSWVYEEDEDDSHDYNYTDKPDYEDHDDNHEDPDYEKPAEGECSREAMKDWRHAMEKWQKSYKGKNCIEREIMTK